MEMIYTFTEWQLFFLGIQISGLIGYILTQNNILFILGAVPICAIMLLFKTRRKVNL